MGQEVQEFISILCPDRHGITTEMTYLSLSAYLGSQGRITWGQEVQEFITILCPDRHGTRIFLSPL